ncbi:MAG: MinD/ParA family protein [Chromatiales bacterium]|nr:MinD/ParA family protein [Chromatiales bacterium]
MTTAKTPSNLPVRVITVMSGKGGVGKTNISVNLALALRESGDRVILWDMDLGLANVDILLNLKVSTDLSHVLNGEKSISEVIIEGPNGLLIVPGASGDADLANIDEKGRKHLIDAIEELTQQTDWLIIDSGAGISENVLAFAASMDEIILATTPEPTAVIDAYAVIKQLAEIAPSVQIHLVVNMVKNRRDFVITEKNLSVAARNFIGSKIENSGFIPYDSHVGHAVRRRTPFFLEYPKCNAAIAIQSLAKNIKLHPPSPSETRASDENFLSRFWHHLKT